MQDCVDLKPEVFVYTDGACSGNPGVGGWGVLLRMGEHERTLSGGALETTNNRMELQAVIEGLRALNRPCRVVVYTDSQYVKNGITTWLKGWKAKNWCGAGKKPIKNRELWEMLDSLLETHEVICHWVRGHSGHVENERVDRLAVEALAQIRDHHKASG